MLLGEIRIIYYKVCSARAAVNEMYWRTPNNHMQSARAAVSTFVEKSDDWARQTRLLVCCLHLHASARPTASLFINILCSLLRLCCWLLIRLETRAKSIILGSNSHWRYSNEITMERH